MKSTNKNKPKPKSRAKPKVKPKTNQTLLQEIEGLRARLEEQEETLRAIRDGEVDALMVSNARRREGLKPTGCGSSLPYLYRRCTKEPCCCTPPARFSMPTPALPKWSACPWKASSTLPLTGICGLRTELGLRVFWRKACGNRPAEKSPCVSGRGQYLAARISVAPFAMEGKPCVCAVVTDISEIQKYLEIIEAGRLVQTVIEQSTDCIIVCDTQGMTSMQAAYTIIIPGAYGQRSWTTCCRSIIPARAAAEARCFPLPKYCGASASAMKK